MKKALLLFALCLVLVVSLAACGGNKTGTETPSTDEGKTNQPSGEFKPETIPASKINPRDIVVDYMYEMANIEWTPSEDIDSTAIIDTLYYHKGTKYKGIMYVTGSRTMTDADEFRAQLNEKGEYIGPPNKDKGFGNHCSSAIRLAYDRVSSEVKFDYTGEMVPHMNQGMLPVGNYEYESAHKTTYGIYDVNPNKEVFYDAFALLQKGDAILTCWPKANDPDHAETGHARMVISVEISRNAAGKINPHKSKVICIEQTSSFDKLAEQGVNTTWFVEHEYTFSKLVETKYIPLTIAAFEEKGQDTEFSVKSANTPKNITSGNLKGIVRSTYLPINSVTSQVLDANGQVVATQTFKNVAPTDPLVFQFQNAKADEAFTTLAKGTYTYEIIAHTTYGSAKAHQFTFTVE